MSSKGTESGRVEPTEMPNGGPPTTSDELESVRQKALAEEIMCDDSEVLRKLAE